MSTTQLRESLKQRACESIDKLKNDLVGISHDIHAHPEENYEEHYAHKRLTDAIGDNKLDVTRKAYDIDTAFDVAVGSKGTTVAVLCEYDALPGIGHACGHNIIAAALQVWQKKQAGVCASWARRQKKVAAEKLRWRAKALSPL